jgi:hypothetical protein
MFSSEGEIAAPVEYNAPGKAAEVYRKFDEE